MVMVSKGEIFSDSRIQLSKTWVSNGERYPTLKYFHIKTKMFVIMCVCFLKRNSVKKYSLPYTKIHSLWLTFIIITSIHMSIVNSVTNTNLFICCTLFIRLIISQPCENWWKFWDVQICFMWFAFVHKYATLLNF